MPEVIDANILLYAANSDAVEHGTAMRFLARAGTSSESWFFTEGNLFFDVRTVVTDFLQFSGIEVINPLRE